MKSNYTHITILLDRSGSMASIKRDTINGLNGFMAEQRKVKGECTVSLWQFDKPELYGPACIEALYRMTPVFNMVALTDHSYQPRGWTPLYDALGVAIEQTGKDLEAMPEHRRPAKVIFVIGTDGMENMSTEFTQAVIAEKIRHQTGVYNWQFVYFGINAIEEAGKVGISAWNAMDYTANAAGTQSMYRAAAMNCASFREGASDTMAWSAEQRREQEDAKRAK